MTQPKSTVAGVSMLPQHQHQHKIRDDDKKEEVSPIVPKIEAKEEKEAEIVPEKIEEKVERIPEPEAGEVHE